jgi:hypothetical protein
MKAVILILRVLQGAIKGGGVAFIAVFILISIFGIGMGGPFMALSLSGAIIVFVVPFGLATGAILKTHDLLTTPAHLSGEKLKNDSQPRWWGVPLTITLLALSFVAITTFLYTQNNVNRIVMHGATWTTTLEPYGSETCNVPMVVLMVKEYGSTELICSEELLDYLQSTEIEIIPITYNITSDFGQVRSYQLIQAGPVTITWETWVGGPGGCGGEYYLPCGSPLRKEGNLLDHSSWPQGD